jgi:hypothetical protein
VAYQSTAARFQEYPVVSLEGLDLLIKPPQLAGNVYPVGQHLGLVAVGCLKF